MFHVREADIEGIRAPAPNARTLKHAVTPWGGGSDAVWMGFSIIDEGSSSNRHHHTSEEIFIVMEGRGRISVAEESVEVEPGSVVRVPPGVDHQIVNAGTGVLKVACVATPAFAKSDFDSAHRLGKGSSD